MVYRAISRIREFFFSGPGSGYWAKQVVIGTNFSNKKFWVKCEIKAWLHAVLL
jgi:hypothetical protein